MQIPCSIYRGGTSKAIFFHDKDLPRDQDLRDKVLLRIFGSPDRRQIDGLGGADILTSKVAVIRPGSALDADADYVFGQVGIEDSTIDWTAICGNISAAVGPFAIDEKLVTVREPLTDLTIYCPIYNKVIKSGVPVLDGVASSEGEFAIQGVPGTGAKISLDYSGMAGGSTGKLLPTGKVRDTLYVKDVGEVEFSFVDCSNPFIHMRAEDLGLKGNESPTEIEANVPLKKKFDKIRRAVVEMLGMEEKWGWHRIESPVLPGLAIVQKPCSYINYASQEMIQPHEMDFFAMLYSANTVHKAYAGTSSVCTGTAAMIDSTVVNEVMNKGVSPEPDQIMIGHPCGFIPVIVKVNRKENEFIVDYVKLLRTARRIMKGYAYIPDRLWDGRNG